MGIPGGPDRDYRGEVEGYLRAAHEEVEREVGPMQGIGLAIIQASTNCRDATKCFIEGTYESDRQQKEIYLFFEFLYFFMHMTLRKAFGRVSVAQMKGIQDFLIEFIPATAIDSYFAHWPSNLKEKMIGEFMERLNDAEGEYAACTADGEIARIPMLLTQNVSELLGRSEINEQTVGEILEIVVSELEGMQLNKLIDALRQVSR